MADISGSRGTTGSKTRKPISGDDTWRAYKGHPIEEDQDGYYVLEPHDSTDYREYRPLVDTPDLFLEFARLADGGKVREEAWGKWLVRYGVLGLGYRSPRDAMQQEEPLDRQQGERWESLKTFEMEALRANRLLRLYESVSFPGEPDDARSALTQTLLRGWRDEGAENLWPSISDPAEVREQALTTIQMEVGRKLLTECYPKPYRDPAVGDSLYVQGWGFHSLLGALYLQMMWLMISPGEQIRRCKRPDCPRIITFKQPESLALSSMKKNDRSMGYRTRKDKEYCSDKCRGRDYYHRQVKPKRRNEDS